MYIVIIFILSSCKPKIEHRPPPCTSSSVQLLSNLLLPLWNVIGRNIVSDWQTNYFCSINATNSVAFCMCCLWLIKSILYLSYSFLVPQQDTYYTPFVLFLVCSAWAHACASWCTNHFFTVLWNLLVLLFARISRARHILIVFCFQFRCTYFVLLLCSRVLNVYILVIFFKNCFQLMLLRIIYVFN